MKKFLRMLAAVLSVAILVSAFSLGAFAIVMGDVNSDGYFNTKDVLAIRKYLAGQSISIDVEAADVVVDGTINSKDVLKIRKVLAGIDKMPEPAIKDVPSDYPTTEISAVAMNQVGYECGATKIARITATNFKDTYDCYVVDKATGKVVFNALSEPAVNISEISGYVSKFDFSSVTKAGEYYIATPLGRSYTVTISETPYNKVQDAMTTALYYSRCGCAIDSSIVGDVYAHGPCHNDSNVPVYFMNILDSATGKYSVDKVNTSTADKFSGGLHDAGDYGRYTTPAVQVVADCIYMNEMFGTGCTTDVIIDNSNEKLPDVLDQARYEMKWLLKMQNQKTGGVYFRIATKAFSGWDDMPDKDSYYNGANGKGLYVSREMVKPTAGFAGAAASCYTAFKNIDPTFATQCLNAAKYAYSYVEENAEKPGASTAFSNASEGGYVTAGEYGSAEIYGDYFFAASALYRATNESKYNDKVKQIYDEKIDTGKISATVVTAYNIGGAGTLAYLLNDKADAVYQQKLVEKLNTSAKSVQTVSKKDKYNSPITNGSYYWGSNANIASSAKICAFYDYFSKTTTYRATTQNLLNFIMGCNFTEYCFITGFGGLSPKDIHYRPSMAAKDLFNTEVMPGWVVSGIKSGSSVEKNYKDTREEPAFNEPCVYWNTSPMFATAYLMSTEK